MCHAYMCWICCERIDGYDHFRDSSRCNTFSMDETFDNTDIKQPNFMPEPYPLPIHNPPVLGVSVNQPTVNSEIFAMVLILRNFADVKFRRNETLTKW